MAGDPNGSRRWDVRTGEGEEFIKRWQEFLAWSREAHQALTFASLIRSDTDQSRFASFAEWETSQDRATSQNSDGFLKRFSSCRELADDFEGGDFTLIASV